MRRRPRARLCGRRTRARALLHEQRLLEPLEREEPDRESDHQRYERHTRRVGQLRDLGEGVKDDDAEHDPGGEAEDPVHPVPIRSANSPPSTVDTNVSNASTVATPALSA